MNTPTLLAIGFLAGLVLGAAFFGGLWWTARRFVLSSRGAGLIAISYIGRLVLLAVGLVLLARIDAALLVGSLPGLIIARLLWTRATRIDLRPAPPFGAGGSDGGA